MSHHKRGRPKNRRAGCLMCKPEKQNGLKGNRRRSRKYGTMQERKSNEACATHRGRDDG